MLSRYLIFNMFMDDSHKLRNVPILSQRLCGSLRKKAVALETPSFLCVLNKKERALLLTSNVLQHDPCTEHF